MPPSQPTLKKRFGQHHLIRPGACRSLVDYLGPAGRRVLEIGPGGGVLTAELLRSGATVDAVEVDLGWAFELRRRHLPHRQQALRLAAADVMSLDLERWPGGTLAAGNLPYQIATALIRRILGLPAIFPRAAFLVQREVGERLTAKPGDSDYGALSVLTQARAEVSWLGTVRRGAFRPPPKVEGAFIGLAARPAAEWPAPTERMEEFIRFVRLAFSQRRKTLRNSLARELGPERAEAALSDAGFPPSTRAQELSVAGFRRLFDAAHYITESEKC